MNAVVQVVRHHFRHRRGLLVCAMCGKPKADTRHWESER